MERSSATAMIRTSAVTRWTAGAPEGILLGCLLTTEAGPDTKSGKGGSILNAK